MKLILRLTNEQAEKLLAAVANKELPDIQGVRDVTDDEQEYQAHSEGYVRSSVQLDLSFPNTESESWLSALVAELKARLNALHDINVLGVDSSESIITLELHCDDLLLLLSGFTTGKLDDLSIICVKAPVFWSEMLYINVNPKDPGLWFYKGGKDYENLVYHVANRMKEASVK